MSVYVFVSFLMLCVICVLFLLHYVQCCTALNSLLHVCIVLSVYIVWCALFPWQQLVLLH